MGKERNVRKDDVSIVHIIQKSDQIVLFKLMDADISISTLRHRNKLHSEAALT